MSSAWKQTSSCSVKYQVLVFPLEAPSWPPGPWPAKASEAEGGFQPQRNEAPDAQLSSLSECCRRWAWGEGCFQTFLGGEETFSCLSWTPPHSHPSLQRFGIPEKRNDERGFRMLCSSANHCFFSWHLRPLPLRTQMSQDCFSSLGWRESREALTP